MQFSFCRQRLILMALPALIPTCAFAGVKEGVEAWQRGDYAAAVTEWRGPAKSGDADAQFNLAQAYKLGRGVPADMKMAQDLYAKAARQGHAQAEANYGLILFQNGKRDVAIPWLVRAAERGDPRAQYVYGTALFNGDSVPKDWVKAYALMTRASASGLPQAAASLTEMDKYLPLAQRQQGIALARKMAGDDALAAQPSPHPPESATASATIPAPDISSASDVHASPRSMPEPVAKRASVVAVATPAPAAKVPSPAAEPNSPKSGWRVQLGAFGDQAAARTQWARVKPKVPALAGAEPFIATAGNVVRLQAGPFATKAGADRVCASAKTAGVACFPVKF